MNIYQSKIKSRKLNAFTLIELLVVIAIISLLVSILLPSLNRAKELTKRVICASNLHHITMAYTLYAAEYNNCVPVGYSHGRKQFNYLAWDAGSGIGYVVFGNLYLADVVPEPRVLYCPSPTFEMFDLSNNPWPPGTEDPTQYTRAGYGARPEVRWINQNTLPNPFPKLYNLASKAVVADLVSYPSHLDERHKTGVNVGYGDGSSGWVARELFNDELELLDGGYSVGSNVHVDAIWEVFDERN